MLPEPFTFSQSSLQDYADCPRRFWLRYIEQLEWPAPEAEPVSEVEMRQQEALLFHRLVQQRFLGLSDAKLTAMAASPNVSRWWHAFLAHAPDLAGYRVHVEKALTLGVGHHRLISKYDCIAVRDGKAVIFDWKTHARKPSAEWLAARWQTHVYRATLVMAGSELNEGTAMKADDVEMVYWLAEFPTEPIRLSYDERQFKREWSAIEALVAEIAAATDFPLTDDVARCRFCTYRSLCDRGEKAGDWHEMLDETASSANFELNFEQIGEIEF